jgi:hypothetical protein
LSGRRALALGAALLAAVACQSTTNVAGVLIDVESTGLQSVQAVTLRSDDGRERRITMGDEARARQHPPTAGHLRAHMTNGDRVTIRIREGPSGPVAIEFIDG